VATHVSPQRLSARVALLRRPGDFPGGAFQHVRADLSAFAGQTVQLRFAFDSVDGGGNAFEGWYVDDIVLLGPERQR